MSYFDMIAGYENEKRELRKICDILNNRDYYLQKGAKMPKGIIFYGNAGNGKTLFTHVLSKECDLPMYVIDLGDSKDENSILRQIKKAFDKAKKSRKYSIIFIDELDKILPDVCEKYVTDRAKIVLTQLLTLIDGINKDSHVFFVATCNNFGSIPESMLRPGRIDKKIMLPNPDYPTRKEILSMYIGKVNCSFETDIKEIASRTAGFSCSGLETLVNECVLDSDENNFVSETLVFRKINEISRQDIQRDKSDEEKRIVSCHNLGYFLVANTLHGDSNYILDLQKYNVGNDFFAGVISGVESGWGCDDEIDPDDLDDDDYEEDYEDDCEEKKIDYGSLTFEEIDDWSNAGCDDDDDFCNTRKYYCFDDLRNAICVVLGGMAAEKAVFGKTYDDIYADLSAATGLMIQMSENGMLGFEYVYNECRDLPYGEKRIDAINEKFEQILNECYEKAEKIVLGNIDLLRYLQGYLIREETIKRDRAEELIANFKNPKDKRG